MLNKEDFTNGSINLNPEIMRLRERGEAMEFDFSNIDLQNIQPGNVQGILPVIINITPVTNLPLLLGLTLEPEEEKITKL